MPRYTNEAGVVVDIPEDLAGRLGGYTPVETDADTEASAAKSARSSTAANARRGRK